MLTRNINTVLKRIFAATERNAVSVFVIVNKKEPNMLEILYADTVEAHRRKFGTKRCTKCDQHLKTPKENWIGDFHNGHNYANVKAFLMQALEDLKKKEKEALEDG